MKNLYSIISQKLCVDIDKLQPDSRFESLGADSLDMVEILMEIEDSYKISFDSEEEETFLKSLCVDDIVKLLKTFPIEDFYLTKSNQYNSVQDMVKNSRVENREDVLVMLDSRSVISQMVALRLRNGVSQKEMAKRMGITKKKLRKIEESSDEKLCVKTMIRYARCLNYKLEIDFI